MIATKNPYIKSAYHTLQVISQDDEKRLEYEARQKAILDHNQYMLEAEERGRTAGLEEGKYEKALEIAKNMLIAGAPIDFVSKTTTLSIKQVKSIAAALSLEQA